MAEFLVPEEWIGKCLADLKIREKYNINLIGIKQGDEVNVNLKPDEIFNSGCTVIAIGKNKDLNKVSEK